MRRCLITLLVALALLAGCASTQETPPASTVVIHQEVKPGDTPLPYQKEAEDWQKREAADGQ